MNILNRLSNPNKSIVENLAEIGAANNGLLTFAKFTQVLREFGIEEENEDQVMMDMIESIEYEFVSGPEGWDVCTKDTSASRRRTRTRS